MYSLLSQRWTKPIGLGTQKSQTLSIPNMNVWIVTPGSNSCAAWIKLMDCMIGVWLTFLQCTLVTIVRRFPICDTSYFSVGSSCLCTPKTKAIHHHLPFLTSVRLCQKVASPSCDLLSMIAQLSTRWDIKVINYCLLLHLFVAFRIQDTIAPYCSKVNFTCVQYI